MPTFMELQSRLGKKSGSDVRLGGDEVLVADARAQMTPKNFIEQKLRAVLTVGRDKRTRN